MSTSRSPLTKLRVEAIRVASVMKRAEKREFGGLPARLVAARERPEVVFGVVQDDKVIQITMAWQTIADTTDAALAEYIVGYMQGRGAETEGVN